MAARLDRRRAQRRESGHRAAANYLPALPQLRGGLGPRVSQLHQTTAGLRGSALQAVDTGLVCSNTLGNRVNFELDVWGHFQAELYRLNLKDP